MIECLFAQPFFQLFDFQLQRSILRFCVLPLSSRQHNNPFLSLAPLGVEGVELVKHNNARSNEPILFASRSKKPPTNLLMLFGYKFAIDNVPTKNFVAKFLSLSLLSISSAAISSASI